MGKEVPKFEDTCKSIKEGNISLILESYNDIFSDFDPRPYNERALSNDFLDECKRAARDKTEENGMELRLLIQKHKRNLGEESKIKRRLKNHFIKHYAEKEHEIFLLKREGFFWFVLGTAVMILGAFLLGHEGFIFHLLTIIVEPAGWFLFWEGLEKTLIETKKKRFTFEFYKKMRNAQVYFYDY